MVYDPKVYRNSKDGIGGPADAAATTSTEESTLVSLAKGIFETIAVTGVTTTLHSDHLGAGTATNALRTVTATNSPDVTALQLIDDIIIVDDAAFTPATTKVAMIGAFADESAPDSVDEGDGGALRMTLTRGLHVNLRNASGTELALASGAVSAATLRVILATDDPAVTSLAILDDWDESDRAKVNLIASQAGITGGAGSVAANTPRVTHASDDPVTTAVQIMDDWDESDRAKVNIIVGQAGVAAGAGSVSATVQRVTLANDDPAIARLSAPSVGTATNVNDTASDTTILASNASRKGATFFNDSTALLYLLLANATSSATAHTVQIPAGAYYELPVCQGGVYTGIVKGIWASDASGAVRVTEFT